MKDVVRSGSVAFILRLLGLALGYGFNVLLARFLGPESTGIYYLALTVTMVAGTFARLGMDNSLLRFTATSASQGDWAGVRGLYRKGLGLGALISIAVSIIIIGIAPWISLHLFSEPTLTLPLQIMTLSILPLCLLTLLGQLLRGLEKIAGSSFIQSLSVPLINLPLLILLHRLFGLFGAVIAYVTATVLTLLLGYVLWRRATPQLKGVRGTFETRILLSTSFPLLVVSLMSLGLNWTDTFLLGIWADSASVGIYGAAVRVARSTSVILMAVNSIAAPKFATLYFQEDYKGLSDFARNVTKLTVLVATPIFIVFVFAPGLLMGFFGEEFRSGAAVLAILSVGQFVNVVSGPVGNILVMCGYEKLMRNNVSLFALVNLGLNIVLIPNFGIVGAAVAGATTLALVNLTSLWLVRTRLSIDIIPVPRWLLRSQ